MARTRHLRGKRRTVARASPARVRDLFDAISASDMEDRQSGFAVISMVVARSPSQHDPGISYDISGAPPGAPNGACQSGEQVRHDSIGSALPQTGSLTSRRFARVGIGFALPNHWKTATVVIVTELQCFSLEPTKLTALKVSGFLMADKNRNASPAGTRTNDRDRIFVQAVHANCPLSVSMADHISAAVRSNAGDMPLAVDVGILPDELLDERPVLDVEGSLKRLRGDRRLFREFFQVFHEDVPSLVAALRAGVAERDGPMIERAAHRLRGLVLNFGAYPVAQAAANMELAGQTEAWDRTASALARLERTISRLQAELDAYHREWGDAR